MSKLSALHWFAVLLSLLLTTGAWYFTSLQVQNQAQNRFDRYSDQVIRLVRERMMHYEDTLSSGVAAIHAAGGDMTHRQWVEFASALDIDTKYPGINGMGVIYKVERDHVDGFVRDQRDTRPEFRIHPEHDGDTLYPITYIEPVSTNLAAVGLDMAHEENRLQATLRARDTGQAQVTAPIVLVQDAQKTPGFLFYMPYYTDGLPETLQERRDTFVGMVYAPFVFQKLIKGVLGKENRLVHFSINDDGTQLYSEQDEMQSGFEPEFRRTIDISDYGRNWTFDIWETPQFQEASHSNEPIMILIGGLIIDGLLFGLFVTLANSNKRALGFADRMTREASDRAESLQRSNEDLERFAYVASHDLKTPLRGIGFLAECIRDDIETPIDHSNHAELMENLGMLDDQVRHMDSLITGILAYSSVRTQTAEHEMVNTSKLAASICASSGLKPHQFVLTGDKVDFQTDVIRLQQVLQNLVGNAYKYHPDVNELMVTIDVKDTGQRLEFTVSDNGVGIDDRYHEKIFEMFQTLQAEKVAGSTGIGLAIVQKIVTLYGGTIRLNSQPGEGSSFTFDWPKTLSDTENAQVAA
ncbi:MULTISPECIES: CHASE domain-containing protein [unclassified Roseovarius]|uniref:sensor histidine kinase n=1 Tax=unclassified Roseovarius TaxID=2614913 RepID=UPI00273E3ADB|nr:MULTISPECIES: CHASE domain-containing protein [unclassified Roseovarius]